MTTDGPRLSSPSPGTILLDCVNLSPAAGKVTPRDVACISLLEARFPELPARDAVFEALQAAKFDVSGPAVASGAWLGAGPWDRPFSLGTRTRPRGSRSAPLVSQG